MKVRKTCAAKTLSDRTRNNESATAVHAREVKRQQKVALDRAKDKSARNSNQRRAS
jgi:hypothetical protein